MGAPDGAGDARVTRRSAGPADPSPEPEGTPRRMSRRPTRRVPAVGVLVPVLLAVLALAGCSAGAVTQTDTTVTSVTGAQGQVGDISILNLSIDPGPAAVVPAGSTVFLRGSMVNVGSRTDRLVAVSSPYASSVQAQGQTVVPGDNATALVGADPVPVGPPVPGLRLSGTALVSLVGVTQVLHAGPTYPVTLTFERSGSITLPASVITSGPVPVA